MDIAMPDSVRDPNPPTPSSPVFAPPVQSGPFTPHADAGEIGAGPALMQDVEYRAVLTCARHKFSRAGSRSKQRTASASPLHVQRSTFFGPISCGDPSPRLQTAQRSRGP